MPLWVAVSRTGPAAVALPSLAAIQGLRQMADELSTEGAALKGVAVTQQAEIEALRAENRALAGRMERLEAVLAEVGR